MASSPNPQRVRVDITGMQHDGSSFLIRAWADVFQMQTPQGRLHRLSVELVQQFVYGQPPGAATDEALRESRRRARRLRQARAAIHQEVERVQLRRTLRLVRDTEEELGRRVRRRVEEDQQEGQQDDRDWGEGPSQWPQAEANPTPSPWAGAAADRAEVELAEGHPEQEDQRP